MLACNPPVATPPATQTETPTATSITDTPTPVETTAPVNTEAAADVATCEPNITTTTLANVRSGPGVNYPVAGSIPQGGSAHVAGKNADGSWWYIDFPGAAGGYAWIAGIVTTSACIPATLAIIAAPPAPAVIAQPPSNTISNQETSSNSNKQGSDANSGSSQTQQQPVQIVAPLAPFNLDITRQCSDAKNGFNQTTQFTWDYFTDTGNQSGFNIYKDGALIASLGPTTLKFVDEFFVSSNARTTSAVYGVSAYNTGGESAIKTANINFCK